MSTEKSPMWRAKFYSAVASVTLMSWLANVAMAQGQDPKQFASPADASKALFAALQSNDERALLDILGRDGKSIVSSGDAKEDSNDRANIVRRYREMHRLVKEPDGTVTLYIGARNWPLPIPLVSVGSSWQFDTAAGQKEILYRRVGRNEIATIRVCKELVAAQQEYYVAHHDQYAAKIVSDQGRHDGLYWKADGSEPRSPIGPMLAFAVADAPGRAGTPTPYHGYFYRILTGQGKSGAGFAFVAYPAEYRSSGVMSFIVGQDGVVYQKDLGQNSAASGQAIKQYNPDTGWNRSEDAQEKAAASRPAR
jgi:hypothetical protein